MDPFPDLHRLSRRDFLKLSGVLLGASALAVIGLDQRAKTVLESGQFLETLDLLHTIDTAIQNNKKFLDQNLQLATLASELLPSPANATLDFAKYFFPPAADSQILSLLAVETHALIDTQLSLTSPSDAQLKKLINDLLKEGQADNEYRKVDTVRRWQSNIELVPSVLANVSQDPVIQKFQETYPLFHPVVVEVGSNYAHVGQAFVGTPRPGLVGHEIAHTFDPLAFISIIHYFSPQAYSDILKLRLKAINFDSYLNAPLYEERFGVDYPDSDPSHIRLIDRIFQGDISQLSVSQIRAQSLVYPTMFAGKRARDLYPALMRHIYPLTPDRLTDLLVDLNSATVEHFAEIGGAYLYLAAGFEGEPGKIKAQELLQVDPAVQCLDATLSLLKSSL